MRRVIATVKVERIDGARRRVFGFPSVVVTLTTPRPVSGCKKTKRVRLYEGDELEIEANVDGEGVDK